MRRGPTFLALAVLAIGCGGSGAEETGSPYELLVQMTSGHVLSTNGSGADFDHTDFLTTPLANLVYSCPVAQTAGACSMVDCARRTPTDPGHIYPLPGAMELTGGRFPASWDPQDGPKSVSALLFAGGERLTVTAAARQVPAFSASVVAPPSAVLMGPPGLGKDLRASKSSPLLLTWTGGVGSQLALVVRMPTAGGSKVLLCSFDGTPGSGQIPAELMAQLPGSSTEIIATTENSTMVMAGHFPVRFVAASPVSLGGAGAPLIIPLGLGP